MEFDAELSFTVMLRVAVLAFPKTCHVFLWRKEKTFFHLKLSTMLVTDRGGKV